MLIAGVIIRVVNFFGPYDYRGAIFEEVWFIMGCALSIDGPVLLPIWP